MVVHHWTSIGSLVCTLGKRCHVPATTSVPKDFAGEFSRDRNHTVTNVQSAMFCDNLTFSPLSKKLRISPSYNCTSYRRDIFNTVADNFYYKLIT